MAGIMCQWSGVLMTTASMSLRLMMSRKSPVAAQPLYVPLVVSWAYLLSARCLWRARWAESTSHTATTRQSLWARKPLMFFVPSPPQPIRPSVILLLGAASPPNTLPGTIQARDPRQGAGRTKLRREIR